MAQPFDAGDAPFNRLSPEETATVRAALDIGYFRPGETIIARVRDLVLRGATFIHFGGG
jgi:CBS domain-containing protein